MGCCTEKLDTSDPARLDLVWERKAKLRLDRRELLMGSAGIAGLAMTGRAKAQETVKLAFCSQLLCVVPYEFTRAQGLFEAEGLSVELVYTRGGNAAMQALVGGAVDYAGDLVRRGAAGLRQRRADSPLRHHRPAAALRAGGGAVRGGGDRRPQGAGGPDPSASRPSATPTTPCCSTCSPRRAPTRARSSSPACPNLFEALRRGQIAAGMVQEPALTLIVEDGGKVLFNAMDIADFTRLLAGRRPVHGRLDRAEAARRRGPRRCRRWPARSTPTGPSAPPRSPRSARRSRPNSSSAATASASTRSSPATATSLRSQGGGDRRRGLRARVNARGGRRAEARHRPRRTPRHRGRRGSTSSSTRRAGGGTGGGGAPWCGCATSACATATPSR